MKRKLLQLLLAMSLLVSMPVAANAATTTGGGPDDFMVDVSLPLMPSRTSGLYDDPEKPLPGVNSTGFIADIDGWTPMLVENGLPVAVGEADAAAVVITDAAGLQAITAGNYVLGADIDLTGKGWTPIKVSGSLTLDGQGHTIKGLALNMTGKKMHGGLFSEVTDDLTVKNLRLEDCSMNTSDDTSVCWLSGLLAGKVSGTLTLENLSVVDGYIKLDCTNVGSVGGLVGEGTKKVTLRNVSAETCIYRDPDMVGNSITLGYNAYLGGLIGCAVDDISAENCYGKTEINVTDADCAIGGMVGSLGGSNSAVKNCRMEADITSCSTSGGLIGRISANYADGKIIRTENCVVLADLETDNSAGGYIGLMKCRTLEITDSRYRGTITSNEGGPAYVGGLVGLYETAVIRADGCSSDLTWKADCADKTAPAVTGSVAGLAGYSSADSDLEITGCSIALTVEKQYAKEMAIGGICGKHHSSGGYAEVEDTFAKVQVGLHHVGTTSVAGMIPCIGDAEFVNCGANVDIDLTALDASREYAAGLCLGVDDEVTFAKCYAAGRIDLVATEGDGVNTGTVNAAGLAETGQFSQCYAGVDITVNSLDAGVGGMLLDNGDGKAVTSCWSDAALKVFSEDGNVGGLARYTSGAMSNCCFIGTIDVENVTDLGGIAGRGTGTFRNCYAETDLANGRYIGGIVGADYVANTTNIYDCRFTGSIEDAGEYAAGILCYGNGGAVYRCEVDAEIDCPDAVVGGVIAGDYNASAIHECHVSGSVRGRLVGGIAGDCYYLSIYNCTVSADVGLSVTTECTKSRGAGGIAFKAHIIQNCHMLTHMNIYDGAYAPSVGGICAESPYSTPNRTEIHGCTSKGVTCYGAGSPRLGGIAGGAGGGNDSFVISSCRVNGDVCLYVDGTGGDVGGICGGTTRQIYGCVMNGDVVIHVNIPEDTSGKGTISAGGIAGFMGNSANCILSRSYHMGSVSVGYSGEPTPNINRKHPLVGDGGVIQDVDFSVDSEQDEETYTIRTFWHEEYDTIMRPLEDVDIYVAGSYVGTTDESGELTINSEELEKNSRLVVSAEKDGYRGTEKEAWFADDGVLNLYLMKKTSGKIYLKAARIYDDEDKATELLYTNSSVTILQQDNAARKMYFEVDWNDLQTEGRTFQLVNEDGSRSVDLKPGTNMYLNLNEYFKPGDKIWVKATAYDDAGVLQESKDQLGLSIQAIQVPDLPIETAEIPLGDNNGIRGIDFLAGLDMGLKGSLNPWAVDATYINNVFKMKFDLDLGETPKLNFLNTKAKMNLHGVIQAAAKSMDASLKDADWSGGVGLEVALDPALDYGMTVLPLAFNTTIKANLSGDVTLSGKFSDPIISGTVGGGADFNIIAGYGAAAGDMAVIAGPELGAKGEMTCGLKSLPDDVESITDASVEGDVSVALMVKAGEFFEFHPSYQLGRFKWTNKDGWKKYAFGVELNSVDENLCWTPADRSYLEGSSGFYGEAPALLAWNDEISKQGDTQLLYENIMLNAVSDITVENGVPVLYFTADDGNGGADGTVAAHTALWRSEFSNGSWGEPVVISGSDNYVDNLDADGTAAIWVESDKTDTLADLLTSSDVMARINGVTTQLTAGEGYVYDAKISCSTNGSKALAIWFSAPAVTDEESFFSCEERKLMYATYNGTTWSTPAVVNVGESTIVSATPSQSQEDIFWTDENGTMSAYHYSYTAYGGEVLSNIGMSAHQDEYTAAMTLDGLTIWKNKALQATVEANPVELKLICGDDVYCAVWSEGDGIYYADSASGWTRKPLIQTEQQPYGISAAMVDGLPRAVYCLTDYNEDQTALIKHLYTAYAADLSGVDAAVSELVLDDSDLAYAGVLRLTAIVTNLREDALASYTYTLTDEDGKEIEAGEVTDLALGYGDANTCLLTFAPDTAKQHTYTLTVTAEGDADADNNTAEVSTASAAQVVKTEFPMMPSGQFGLEVLVGNGGAAPVENMTVEIYRCETDGATVGEALVSKEFEHVAAGSYRQVTMDKTAGDQFYKVVVLSDGEEVDSDMLMWRDEEAVRIEVGGVTVSKSGSAEVTLYSQNWKEDVVLVLALYQNGQMVSSAVADVAAGWEETQVALELGELLQSDYTCGVFLLQPETLMPVTEKYSIDLKI